MGCWVIVEIHVEKARASVEDDRAFPFHAMALGLAGGGGFGQAELVEEGEAVAVGGGLWNWKIGIGKSKLEIRKWEGEKEFPHFVRDDRSGVNSSVGWLGVDQAAVPPLRKRHVRAERTWKMRRRHAAAGMTGFELDGVREGDVKNAGGTPALPRQKQIHRSKRERWRRVPLCAWRRVRGKRTRKKKTSPCSARNDNWGGGVWVVVVAEAATHKDEGRKVRNESQKPHPPDSGGCGTQMPVTGRWRRSWGWR
jgi:hypothetical protein